MSCTSVVRIGSGASSPDGGGSVSAKLLREAVLSYFARKQPSSSTDSNTLTIANKYFQAKVLLQELGTTTLPSKDDASSSLLQEDGVLLVFDSLKSNPDLTIATGIGDTTESFDALAAVHDQAEAQGTCGDLLRMVVGVSLSSGLSPQELRGTNHEAEYSRRILFCLDRGYEYVEVDLSQEGQAKGHDDREKEGFARVIEAFEGTVWSSAVMSKSKTQELKESYQEEAEKVVQDTNEEEENPYEPPDPSKFAPVSSPNDKNLNNQEKKEPIDPTDMLLDPEQASSEDIQKLRQDMEAEQVFEQMEGLLRQANRVREQSKAGALTDDERRQRAGDAATALMNLMSAFGLDDEDDGDDDDDGSDSSSVADKDDENDDSVVKQTETEATKV